MLGDKPIECRTFDPSKPRAREGFINTVMGVVPDLDRNDIHQQIVEIAVDATQPAEPAPARPESEQLLQQMPEFVRAEAHKILEGPGLLKRCIDDVAELGIAGERELIGTTYLTGTSRLLPKPLAHKLATKYAGHAGAGDESHICQRHFAIQRLLKAWPIVIPYAEHLGRLFTSERVEVRRAFPQLMSMIQASCLLHQKQRQLDEHYRLTATTDDYEIARHLLAGPLSRLLGGRISDPAQRFRERLSKRFKPEQPFTTTEASKRDAQQRTVSGWLGELCGADMVSQVAEHRGSKPAVWKINEPTNDPKQECPQLPPAEALAEFIAHGKTDIRQSDKR